MDENEEFEFRRRYEMEKAAAQASQASHTGTFFNLPPRRESKLADVPEGLLKAGSDFMLGLTQRGMELTGNPRAEFIRRQVANERAIKDVNEAQFGRPSVAETAARTVGDIVPITAIGATLGPSLGAAATGGAIAGALRPSESTAETAGNAAFDALFGLGGALATRAVMPRGVLEPEHRAAIEAGRREGMPFTGGQIANNPIVQRAEAHGMWNPLTKWSAIPMARKQDDAFIKGMLEKTGVPATQIPKNPSLNPQTLNAAHDAIGARYDAIFPANQAFDLSNSARPQLWNSLRALRPANLNLVREDKQLVDDVARQVRQIAYTNNGNVPAPLVHDTIRLVDEARKRLSADGRGRAGAKLDSLYDELLNSLPDRKAYEAVDADYARLMTIEDLLRRSKGMGEGVPDRAKLGAAVERGLPGGVLRNRSSMADLARGGEKSVGVGALPDRATGMPIPSDVANAATYWRWNNPAAKWGLLNPSQRDVLEMGLRYLPMETVRQEQR